MFKNQDNVPVKNSKKGSRPGRSLINQDNFMVLTSSGWGEWTGIPQTKKWKQEVRSHPIKANEKKISKMSCNIFNNHQMFKETLRSTTLDNWRKKFTVQKNSI